MKIFAMTLLFAITFGLTACGGGANVNFPAAQARAVFSIDFDDGYASAYNNGLPIVEAAGYHSTQFIITKAFTWGGGYVSQSQVLDMMNRGHEIGAHTRNHLHLSTLTVAGQQNEIQGSFNDLCALLNHCPTSFAYPYGDYNDESVSTVQATGYATARLLTNNNQGVVLNPPVNGADANPYLIYSYPLSSTTQFAEVQKFIDEVIGQKVWAIIVIHRVDEGSESISISHQLLQQIVDYLKQQNANVQTNEQAERIVGLK